jgi:hypothetical protein
VSVSARIFVLASLLGVAAVAAGPLLLSNDDPPELAPGPGRDLVAINCAVCHSLRLVVDTRMSRADWDASITWMQQKHHLWPFTDEDRALILDYLEMTQGPLDEAEAEVPEDPGPWAQPLYPLNPL